MVDIKSYTSGFNDAIDIAVQIAKDNVFQNGNVIAEKIAEEFRNE
jgi:hypothetical protein